jgi:hypothetical protein
MRAPANRDLAGAAGTIWGYALCGGNASAQERSQQFFDKVDRGRAGATASLL